MCWCLSSTPLDDLCREAAAIGLRSVGMRRKEWETPVKYGLTCASRWVRRRRKGLNKTEQHDRIVAESERLRRW